MDAIYKEMGMTSTTAYLKEAIEALNSGKGIEHELIEV